MLLLAELRGTDSADMAVATGDRARLQGRGQFDIVSHLLTNMAFMRGILPRCKVHSVCFIRDSLYGTVDKIVKK